MKKKKQNIEEILKIILIINILTLIFVFGIFLIEVSVGLEKDCSSNLGIVYEETVEGPHIFSYFDGCGNDWDSTGKLIGKENK